MFVARHVHYALTVTHKGDPRPALQTVIHKLGLNHSDRDEAYRVAKIISARDDVKCVVVTKVAEENDSIWRNGLMS